MFRLPSRSPIDIFKFPVLPDRKDKSLFFDHRGVQRSILALVWMIPLRYFSATLLPTLKVHCFIRVKFHQTTDGNDRRKSLNRLSLTPVRNYLTSFESRESNVHLVKTARRSLYPFCLPKLADLELKMSTWGYSRKNGPHTWADNFPIARGPRQSPIDIDSNTCVNDPALVQNPIVINYDPSHIETLENTGHGFKISTRPDTYSVIEGGPLENKYRLEQFHFHWGKTLTTGSEHTVDGRSYAAEVHLVHWNYEKYESMAKAAENGDGLCVLGTFLTVGNHHPEIQKLIDRFDEISFKNQKITLDGGFDCLTLLPENRSFWTYPGSLTTPPLFECVIWVVFKENIELSAEQLEAFRQLCSYCDGEECPADEFDGKIVANFRPPLDRGERVVREC